MLSNFSFLVIIVIQPALNLPHKRSPVELNSIYPVTQQNIPVLQRIEDRKKKGINIGYPLPIHHHLLLPSQLHVLPATSNVHHSSVQTEVKHIVTSNGHIPIYTQTVSHSSTNITHPTQLMPILVHHNLIPLRDVSVIPLHRAQKFGQLRAKEKQAEDRDDVNRFRTFYGGYGTGLYFGGHGAGHGFYAYGK